MYKYRRLALFMVFFVGFALGFSLQEEEPVMESEPEVVEFTPEPITEVEVVAVYNVPLDSDLQLHIFDLCVEKRIDPTIIIGQIYTESSYNAEAVGDGGDSLGLMQVQPKWNKERMEELNCTDLLDPYQNVTVGIDILAELIDHYDGNVEKALVAYNAGQTGAYNMYFSKGVYSSDYSKSVLAMAELLNSSENFLN